MYVVVDLYKQLVISVVLTEGVEYLMVVDVAAEVGMVVVEEEGL